MTHLSILNRRVSVPLVLTLVAGGLVAVASRAPASAVEVVRSSVSASDGSTHSVVNHLVADTPAVSAAKKGGELLVVWAGDRNAGDTKGSDVQHAPLAVTRVKATNVDAADLAPGPDFRAVIDVDKTSPT